MKQILMCDGIDMKQRFKLMLGDNMESLKKLPDNSIDSVVVDPPYGLGKERDMNIILKDWIEKGYSEIDGKGFMGKEWDAYVPQPIFWKEIFRVLKPGGHILAFFGTRTYDIGTMAIRLAGFEIRDQIMWLYGSGFPKSLNVGKVIEKYKKTGNASWNGTGDSSNGPLGYSKLQKEQGYRNGDYSNRHQSKIEINNEFEGWGTALKPANEPICVARKPLSEKSVAENVLKWGTGGINVDGCRVGSESMSYVRNEKDKGVIGFGMDKYESETTEGRFPANIILECICDEVIKGESGEIKKSSGNREDCELSHEWGYKDIVRTNFTDKGDIHTNPYCPCRLLDEQSGERKVGKGSRSGGFQKNYIDGEVVNRVINEGYNDRGGASRFFYQAKVSKAERNMGLDGFEDKIRHLNLSNVVSDSKEPVKNNHPTIKPVNLMAYLCRLITPTGGIVLDPFMGSGSTGIAAQLEGFRFVGMEMDNDYFKIAEARIDNYEKYKKFLK